MTVHELTAMALTPIHIGGSSMWTPEAFKLEDNGLVRFEPSAVVAAMSPAQLRNFNSAVDRGDLAKAQGVLREAATGVQEVERIAISRASRREIDTAIRDPGRRGEIHPFIRGGDRPFVPGSSLKGAVRTALLSSWAQPDLPKFQAWLNRERIERGWSGQQSTRLQTDVLGGAMDSDPFRFVRVADAELPLDHTRIERVSNRKRGGDVNQMQMHFECLTPGTRFPVRLEVAEDKARRAREKNGSKAPSRIIGADDLFAAIDDFYRGRWAAETERFFREPWMKPLPAREEDGFPILMRIGRFSHFESASVDGLRRGWRPQAKRQEDKTAAEGSTRAVSEQDGTLVTFGWLVLVPTGREAVLDSLNVAPRRSGEGRPAHRSQAGSGPSLAVTRFGTVDDERVEVLKRDGDNILVRFVDSGDIEPVPVSEFKPEE